MSRPVASHAYIDVKYQLCKVFISLYLLCTLAHSFITVVDQVFINEGTSVSLKQKDAWEREGWRGSKEEHMHEKQPDMEGCWE